MKPAAFDYVRPKSLDEAVGILSAAAGDAQVEAQVMAGGQSLVAMMNLRVAAPDLLVDIARLEELRAVSETSDHVVLGACVTHAAIEDGLVPDPSRGLMPDVASNLAYRAVRTRGTLGGSLALSDPAADWPAVMSALAAQVMLRGPAGERSVDAVDFATGVYETVRTKSSQASASRSCPPAHAGDIRNSAGSPASSRIPSLRRCATRIVPARASCSAPSTARRSCSNARRRSCSPAPAAAANRRLPRICRGWTSMIFS
jgi:hypothetical protein